MNRYVFFAIVLCGSLAAHAVDLKVRKIGESLIDPAAMLFKSGSKPRSQPKLKGDALAKAKWLSLHGKYTDAIAFHKGYQYVGYYDVQRQVCLARRRLPAGEWEIIRFADYHWESQDPHNHISIGIASGDGTIHTIFDHHVDPLHYRVSRKGAADNPAFTKWEAALFGPIASKLHGDYPDKVTYPHFWQTPQGGLQFSYRKGVPGKGVTMLMDYDPKTSSWSGTRPVNSFEGGFADEIGVSKSRFGYMKGFVYSPDGKLHNTWVWRENPPSEGNHDLMYAYSEDGGTTWLNNAGEKIDGLPTVDTPGIVVKEVSRSQGISNQSGGNAIDSKGRLHVTISHRLEGSQESAVFHAWRSVEGEWTFTRVESGGKLLIDGEDNAYILSLSTEGLVIRAATVATGWTDWKEIHTERGAFLVDNGRAVTYDLYRLRQENILSVMVQESSVSASPDPEDLHVASSALRMIDFRLEGVQ